MVFELPVPAEVRLSLWNKDISSASGEDTWRPTFFCIKKIHVSAAAKA